MGRKLRVNEKTLVKKVVMWINSLGPMCYAYKRRGTAGNRGMPDVSGAIWGIRIELEGKLPGNAPTPKQLDFLSIFERTKCICGWFDNFELAQSIIIDQAFMHGIIIKRKGLGWTCFPEQTPKS